MEEFALIRGAVELFGPVGAVLALGFLALRGGMPLLQKYLDKQAAAFERIVATLMEATKTLAQVTATLGELRNDMAEMRRDMGAMRSDLDALYERRSEKPPSRERALGEK